MTSEYVFEGDEWQVGGATITAQLSQIAAAVERDVLIVEHWLYRRSSSPSRLFVEEYEEFLAYLRDSVRPGDIVRVWSFSDACRDSNVVASGKCPDSQGRVPRKGAY